MTPTPQNTHPQVQFDWTEWLSHLDETDASDDEKRQLIETLWQIVIAFVDLGWQAGSVPAATAETSGQKTDLTTLIAGIVIQSENIRMAQPSSNEVVGQNRSQEGA